ncbi:MAG: AtpZ/AtpI family protein [Bacteroidia bacterium]
MDKKPSAPKPPNSFFKYSNLVFQMGIVIGLFAWLGAFLDKKYQTSDPWFTICFSLIGIFAGLYLALKDFIKKDKS